MGRGNETIQLLETIRSIDTLRVDGKRVFCRVDLNVPLSADGRITDDSRIKAALPSIQYLRERGAKVILASHLGRPNGQPNSEMSLEPVGAYLAEVLKTEVTLPESCVGRSASSVVNNSREGDVILLENLRFHPGEKSGDADFARELASLADVYVNDAFGTCHRSHASMVAVPSQFKEKAAGFLLQKELKYLGDLLRAPKRPFLAILGGAKVSDKIEVIRSLMKTSDEIIIGGAMAYTFLTALGHDMGRSLIEKERVQLAEKILKIANDEKVQIHLPVDHVVADDFSESATVKTARNGEVEPDWMGMDIGPQTIQVFQECIDRASTILWNGPMGVFEMSPFAEGTNAIARAVSRSGGTTVVGGGDSVSAVKKAGVEPFISHLSTGGGASLNFLEGKVLPGVEALAS